MKTQIFGFLFLSLILIGCSSNTFSRNEATAPPGFVCDVDCTESALSKFGMVTDRVNCVFCHMNVYGDIASTATNPFELHPLSLGLINGDVHTNGDINQLDYTGTPAVPVADPLHQLKTNANYGDVATNASLGFRIFEKANPALGYPSFKSATLKAGVQGSLQNGTTTVTKLFSGNLVLNANASPLSISGEVFVDGDLIIFGKNISGMGTIYVNGNIYIPNDIVVSGNDALFSGYRSNVTGADAIAADAVRNGVSGLRLAARDFVIIGNPSDGATNRGIPAGSLLKNYNANTYQSYYTGENLTGTIPASDTTRDVSRTQLIDDYLSSQQSYGPILGPRADRIRVYNWYPNYNQLLKPEYELDQAVCASGKKFRVSAGSVARIDSTLYAQQGIGGVIDAGGNLLFNGGVVTKNFNLLGATGYSLDSLGSPTGRSHDIAHNVHELEKDCAAAGSGTGTFRLNLNIVNPQNGLPIKDTVLTYDYRLRNGGAGYNLMRSKSY